MKKGTLYKCLNCNIEKICGKNSSGKYCSISCQQEYQYKTVIKPKIESGEYYSVSSKVLKKYLIETRGYKCELCPVGETWNDKPIILQVDHIDGNSDDCSPKNIRLLCPNCHSQTDTFNNKGGNGKKDTKRNKMIRKYRAGN